MSSGSAKELNSQRWLMGGLIIYVISTLISMAVMNIGAGILLIACAMAWRSPRAWSEVVRQTWSYSWVRRYAVISAVLALALTLSLIVAEIAPLGYGGKFIEVDFLSDWKKVWYLVWPLLVFSAFKQLHSQQRSRVLQAWLVAAGILGVVGLFQFFTGWPRMQPIPGFPGKFHAILWLGHHLSVASIFIFPFFAALDLSEKSVGPKSIGLSRGALAGIALLTGVTLFLGYSRMLWLALPVGVVLWVLWVLPRKLSIVGLALVLGTGIFVVQHPLVEQRLSQQMGIQTRIELWKANLEFLRERPLTGAGWYQNEELSDYRFQALQGKNGAYFVGHAHNNVLDLLGGTGILGFLSWILWVGFVSFLMWKAARGKFPISFSRGLICAWIVFHLNGLTQLNFWEAKVMHQMMWMIALTLIWVVESDPQGKRL